MNPYTIGAEPERIDIDVHPGERVDFTVPVYDSTGALQNATGWTVLAQVRHSPTDAVLYAFTLAAGASGVRVQAPEADTASWASWAPSTVPWDLWVTPPANPPFVLAAGWVRVESTISH